MLLIVDDSTAIRKIPAGVAQSELALGEIVEAGDVLEAVEAWKHCQTIMITTEGSRNKVMEAVNPGASGYVRKPFTAEQIKEKLLGLI